jgi:hypothetical protein
MLEMIDEPVRVAHDFGFHHLPRSKTANRKDWPSIFFKLLPRGRASM